GRRGPGGAVADPARPRAARVLVADTGEREARARHGAGPGRGGPRRPGCAAGAVALGGGGHAGLGALHDRRCRVSPAHAARDHRLLQGRRLMFLAGSGPLVSWYTLDRERAACRASGTAACWF